VLVRMGAMALLVLGPFLGLLGPSYLFYPSVAAFACIPVAAFALRARLGQRFFPALLIPFGQLVMVAIVLRSTWVCMRRGGIVWRGTRYGLAELRELQRVKV